MGTSQIPYRERGQPGGGDAVSGTESAEAPRGVHELHLTGEPWSGKIRHSILCARFT